MLGLRGRFAALGLMILALLPSGSCDLVGLFPSPTVDVQLGQVFQIAMGQTARFSSMGLFITFKDVLEDSRCPVDVVCVWAGNAKVTLEVRQTGKAAQALALNSTLEPREVTYEGFRIRFEELMPQPRSDRPIHREEYRLSLRVSK